MSAGNCERGRSGEYYSRGYRYHYRLVCYGTISLSGFFLLLYTILTALFKLFMPFSFSPVGPIWHLSSYPCLAQLARCGSLPS